MFNGLKCLYRPVGRSDGARILNFCLKIFLWVKNMLFYPFFGVWFYLKINYSLLVRPRAIILRLFLEESIGLHADMKNFVVVFVVHEPIQKPLRN